MQITRETLELTGADGGRVPTTVVRPAGPGPHPAVVLGVEAYGPNEFSAGVAARLAESGYVVVAPDYHRGAGPADPEAYTDFTEVIRHLDALDFARATHDVLAAVGYAAGREDVDPGRVALWGWCTGATLALLAAALSDRVAAAVLYFPSQPEFAELTPRTPVHPVDLVWALRCPVLVHYGDQDAVMTPERLDDLRARLARAGAENRLVVHPGAGHAFTAPVPPLRHAEADRAAWAASTEFLTRHVPPGATAG